MLALLLAACDPCGDRARVELDGAFALCAAVATSDEERRAGLSAVPPLGQGDAMLLDFPLQTRVCITTARPGYDIDVLYADQGGHIVAADCGRGPEDPIQCVEDVRRVLELLPREACSDWVGKRLAITP